MVTTVRIPATVDAAVDELEGLAALLTAKEWQRSAIVFAFTAISDSHAAIKRDRNGAITKLSPVEFAKLGINGLRSDNTVRFYHKAWLDGGGDPELTPGQAVELPTIDFLPHPRGTDGYDTEAGLATTIGRAIEQHGAETVVDVVVGAAEPTVVAHPVVREEVDRAVIRTRAVTEGNAAVMEEGMSRIGRARSLRLLDAAVAALRNLVDEVERNPIRERDAERWREGVADCRRLLSLAELNVDGGGAFSDDDREFLAELEGRTS
jgi:hypothetical protein